MMKILDLWYISFGNSIVLIKKKKRKIWITFLLEKIKYIIEI